MNYPQSEHGLISISPRVSVQVAHHVLPGRAVARRGVLVAGRHLAGAALEGVLTLVNHGTMVTQS